MPVYTKDWGHVRVRMDALKGALQRVRLVSIVGVWPSGRPALNSAEATLGFVASL